MAARSHFGTILHGICGAKGVTYEKLAEAAKIDVSYIKKLIAGTRIPPPWTAEDVIGALIVVGNLSSEDQSTLRSAARLDRAGPPKLPTPHGNLKGREREIEEVVRIAAELSGQMRLLTLFGPAGIGKTRVALEAAHRLADRGMFRDGVWWVPLGAIADPDLVPSKIASALHLRPEELQSPIKTLLAFIADHRMLMVLDMFEHVAAAAPHLAQLLDDCPGLTLLLTSQAIVDLKGQEYVVNLPPLPDEDAVALYLDRARGVKGDFLLQSDEDLEEIREICCRLEGNPLAIELAAGHTLAPKEIRERLQERLDLDLLEAITPEAIEDPRHRSLRASIEFSYNLLAAREQAVFRRIAVVPGGCSAQAAEEVCALSGTAVALSRLVLRSLLRQDDTQRYVMPETPRAYAQERLKASGEADEVGKRHADYFLRRAEEAAPKLKGPEQQTWLEQLEQEHDDFRAALRWSQTARHVETLLRLATALQPFWSIRGYASEGWRWLETGLKEARCARTHVDAGVRARALLAAGLLIRLLGDYRRARELHEEALTLMRELNDVPGIARSLLDLGILAEEQGDYERAQELYEESLSIMEVAGDRPGKAVVLNTLGMLARDQGDDELAEMRFGESLALSRELGNDFDSAIALNNLGTVAEDRGDYEAARQRYEESLSLAKGLRDKEGIAVALDNLGIVARKQGDYRRARELHEKAFELKDELGERLPRANSLRNLADLAREQGHYEQAWTWYCESLHLRQAIGDKRGIAQTLEGVGALAAAQGGWPQAVRLLAAAAALRKTVGAPLPKAERAWYEATLDGTRHLGDEQRWSQAWEKGWAMTVEQVIAYACRRAVDFVPAP